MGALNVAPPTSSRPPQPPLPAGRGGGSLLALYKREKDGSVIEANERFKVGGRTGHACKYIFVLF